MDNLQLTTYKLQLTNREVVEPDCRDETQKTQAMRLGSRHEGAKVTKPCIFLLYDPSGVVKSHPVSFSTNV